MVIGLEEPDASGVRNGSNHDRPTSPAGVLAPPSPELSVAIRDLHTLLRNATRFEVDRRRWATSELRARDRDELVSRLADSALANVLMNLGAYDGRSRFTTWACKFAILEASTTMRRRSWKGRPIPPAPELPPDIEKALERSLSVHERELLIAAALNHVPLDVLAERLDTSRGAIYATLKDARRKLRAREPREASVRPPDVRRTHIGSLTD